MMLLHDPLGLGIALAVPPALREGLRRDWVFGALGAEAFDLSEAERHKSYSAGNADRAGARYGIGTGHDGTSNGRIALGEGGGWGSVVPAAGSKTVVVVAETDSTSRSAIVADWQSNGSNASLHLEFDGFSGWPGYGAGRINVGIPALGRYLASDAAFETGRPYCIGYSSQRNGANDNDRRLYVDGVAQAAAHLGGGDDAAGTDLRTGPGAFSLVQLDGAIYRLIVFERALSETEHLALYRHLAREGDRQPVAAFISLLALGGIVPPRSELALTAFDPAIAVSAHRGVSVAAAEPGLSAAVPASRLAARRQPQLVDLVLDRAAPSSIPTTDGTATVARAGLNLDAVDPAVALDSTRDLVAPRRRLTLSGYKAQGIEFDGTNDLLLRTSPLVGVSDGMACTGSAWFKTTTLNVSRYIYGAKGPTSNGFRFAVRDGRIEVDGWDSDSNVVFSIGGTGFGDDEWHHVMFSFDSSKAQMYVDGHLTHSRAGPTGDLAFSGNSHAIGASWSENFKFEGGLADVWIAIGTFIDLAEAENRRKFYLGGDPVDQGGDGSARTGIVPDLWFAGDLSQWASNKGSGGSFASLGAIATASTSPQTAHVPAARADTPSIATEGALALGGAAAAAARSDRRAAAPAASHLGLASFELVLDTGGLHVRTVPSVDSALRAVVATLERTTSEILEAIPGYLAIETARPLRRVGFEPRLPGSNFGVSSSAPGARDAVTIGGLLGALVIDGASPRPYVSARIRLSLRILDLAAQGPAILAGAGSSAETPGASVDLTATRPASFVEGWLEVRPTSPTWIAVSPVDALWTVVGS